MASTGYNITTGCKVPQKTDSGWRPENYVPCAGLFSITVDGVTIPGFFQLRDQFTESRRGLVDQNVPSVCRPDISQVFPQDRGKNVRRLGISRRELVKRTYEIMIGLAKHQFQRQSIKKSAEHLSPW